MKLFSIGLAGGLILAASTALAAEPLTLSQSTGIGGARSIFQPNPCLPPGNARGQHGRAPRGFA